MKPVVRTADGTILAKSDGERLALETEQHPSAILGIPFKEGMAVSKQQRKALVTVHEP